MALPPYVVDGVMQGRALCMLITASASLLMSMLSVRRRQGQNCKCGKKEEKCGTGHLFADEFNGYAIKCKRFYIIRVESSIYFY
jgi:hypothetical protein